MAQLRATQVGDLVATTLRDLGPLRFQQAAQDLQYYEVFSKWFKRDKVIFDSGIGIQRTLMLKRSSGIARHVGLNDDDQTNIRDVLTQMTVDWVHLTTNWGLHYQSDILMNRGRALVLNVIKPRRVDALLNLVSELEERAWGSPPASGNSNLPYGIQYWVVPNATTGFNGGAPSGYTTVGGINPTTYPNWKNYTAQYTTNSKGDLVKTMRTAHRKVRFMSPVQVKDYRGGVPDKYRIYVNETTLSGFEDIGEGQNENLGRDIASMDGMVTFRRIPIVWVPILDSRTDDPVYFIDHSTFYPICLKGDYLRESEAKQNPNNHNAYQVHIDLTYQYLCVDRRRNGVINTAN